MKKSFYFFQISDLLNGKNNYLEECLSKNLSLCGNGSRFTRNKRGFLSEMMYEMFDLRNKFKEEKKKYDKLKETEKDPILLKQYQDKSIFYNNYQNTIKILLNSAFGSLGNPGFRYYHLNYAEAITLSGQLTLIWIEKYINAYFNKILNSKSDYVIYSDTDSIFLNLQKLIESVPVEERVDFIADFLDNKLQKFNDSALNKLHTLTNSYEQKIYFKREKIFSKGIFTGGKKRYILLTHDNEGTRYAEPKINVVGLEAIKSNTPEKVRDMLKETFSIIMYKTNDDLVDYIEKCRKEFEELPIEEIGKPTSMNGLEKYVKGDIFAKGTPIHVRAAGVYNTMIKKWHHGAFI
jgi:DNA polymerase elongation subunit (family B)